jgi:WD40 repeat protein
VAGGIGIWLYDTQTGEELNLIKEHTYGVSCVSFNPDGQLLASGGYDTIRLWNVRTGTIIHYTQLPRFVV